jgi:DNA-binding LytR/AlgR family response regulator
MMCIAKTFAFIQGSGQTWTGCVTDLKGRIMNIAICDGDREQLKTMSRIAEQHPNIRKVAVCTSVGPLIEMCRKGSRYSLIFMDPTTAFGTYDLGVVKKLSDVSPSPKQRVVFLTHAEEYAKLGYGVGAWDFVEKPASKAKLFEMIQRARLEIAEQQVFLQATGGKVKFKFDDIVRIESNYGMNMVYTRDGNYETRLTFAELMQHLPDFKFIQIHRSQLINIDMIHTYTKTKVWMIDKAMIPIGRRYAKTFRDVMEAFV